MEAPRLEAAAWTTLAVLLRPQGRKGEVLAELHTDFPERFGQGARVFLARPGFTGSEHEARTMTVLGHWLPVGRNQGRVVLSFAGVESISAAEELAGLEVLVPESERVELAGEAEYISDLVGCALFDGDEQVGEVTGVEFAMTADGAQRLEEAAPLLTVETADGDQVLIPYVKAFLVALNPERKRIEMNLPEGLVELNRAGPKETARDDPA